MFMPQQKGYQVPCIMVVYCKSEMGITVNLLPVKSLRKRSQVSNLSYAWTFCASRSPNAYTESEAFWQAFFKTKQTKILWLLLGSVYIFHFGHIVCSSQIIYSNFIHTHSLWVPVQPPSVMPPIILWFPVYISGCGWIWLLFAFVPDSFCLVVLCRTVPVTWEGLCTDVFTVASSLFSSFTKRFKISSNSTAMVLFRSAGVRDQRIEYRN